MRIALIVTDLHPPRIGGIAKVATEIARALAQAGHEITCFCLPRTAETFAPTKGLRLIGVKPRFQLYKDYPVLSFSLCAFEALLKEHQKKAFDVSHAMNFNNFGLCFFRRAMTRAGLAHVSTGFESTEMEIKAKFQEFLQMPDLHLAAQILMECFFAPWQRAYLGWSEILTTEDIESKAAFVKKGIAPDHIRLIPSGVDLDSLKSFEPDPAFVQELRSWGSPLYLCTGRVDGRKGTRYLVEAFLRWPKRPPEARLLVVGGSRGTYAQQVKKLCSELGGNDLVRFTGTVDDVRPWLWVADWVVLPSLSEGIPITLQEALAMAKPLLCSKLEGTYDYAKDLHCIHWFLPASIESLISALDKSLSQALAEKARAEGPFFMQDYSWDKVAKKYLESYKEAVLKLKRV